MAAAIEVAYYLPAHPSRAMAIAHIERTWGLALLVVLEAATSSQIAAAVVLGATWSASLDLAAFSLFWAADLVLIALCWLFTALFVQGAMSLFRRPGRLGATLIVLGLACTPLLLLTPAALILGPISLLGLGIFLIVVLPLLLLWSTVMAVIGIRQVYGVSSAGALASLVVPWLIFTVGGFIFFGFCIGALGALFGSADQVLGGLAAVASS